MTVDSMDELTDTFGGLAFWHPLSDAPVSDDYLDWPAAAAGTSADVRLRLRNLSGDYTATGIRVYLGPPAGDGDADVSGAHLLSADGDTFAAACAVDDLAPGQTSAPFVLRRVTAPGDAGGGFTLAAQAGSWAPATGEGDTGDGDTGGDVFPEGSGVLLEDPEEQM